MDRHKPDQQQLGRDINETDTIPHSDLIIENPVVEDVDNSESKKIYSTIAGDEESSSERVKPAETGTNHKIVISCFAHHDTNFRYSLSSPETYLLT